MFSDPYIILELNNTNNITKDDIKKAYKRLILKYHPDKNKNIDTTEKFREIQTAYEILYDDNKRHEYQNLSTNKKNEYYNVVKNIIISKYPNINNYLSFFIKTFYNDNENSFKNDLENFNFKSLCSNILSSNILNTDMLNISQRAKIELDIIGSVNASMKDRYLNKHMVMEINRDTKEPIIIYVPLIDDKYILENEGECENNKHGNIIIDIHIPNEYDIFTKIGKDLYVNIYVSKEQYLNGGVLQFINLDNNIIKMNFGSLVDNCILEIKNKGFFDSKNNRGNMYIICKIKDLS